VRLLLLGARLHSGGVFGEVRAAERRIREFVPLVDSRHFLLENSRSTWNREAAKICGILQDFLGIRYGIK